MNTKALISDNESKSNVVSLEEYRLKKIDKIEKEKTQEIIKSFLKHAEKMNW